MAAVQVLAPIEGFPEMADAIDRELAGLTSEQARAKFVEFVLDFSTKFSAKFHHIYDDAVAGMRNYIQVQDDATARDKTTARMSQDIFIENFYNNVNAVRDQIRRGDTNVFHGLSQVSFVKELNLADCMQTLSKPAERAAVLRATYKLLEYARIKLGKPRPLASS